MSKIYIMFVDTNDGVVDWITYCRASMLHSCLPNCAGVYRLSSPPAQLRNETDGWNLYLLAHGSTTDIGHLSGTELANRLTGIIPAQSTGLIHVQSCATGATPAQDLATRLGKLGHHVFVKAPQNNATFTDEVGFLVLDKGLWQQDSNNATRYRQLVSQYAATGSAAANRIGKTGDLLAGCDAVYQATKPFWKDFSAMFKGVAFPTGQGWNAYETIPGTGAKQI